MGHLKCFPELMDVLLILSNVLSVIKILMKIIERFVILMYNKTSTCCDIDTASRKIFEKNNNVKPILPTKAAHEKSFK